MSAAVSHALCPLCGAPEPHDDNDCRWARRRPASDPLPLIGQKPPPAAGVTTMTTETKALVRAPATTTVGPRYDSFEDVKRIAQACAQSGWWKDSRDAAQAIVKIQAGLELGVPPVAAMTGIHIIEGKPALSANLIASQIRRSGVYDYRIREHDDEHCLIAFFRHKEEIGTSSFSMEEAKRAGVAGKGPWKAYPKAMLFARALSAGARWHTPDVFTGPVYVPEELGAAVDDDGNVVTMPAPAPARQAEKPAPRRSQEGPAVKSGEGAPVTEAPAEAAKRQPASEVLVDYSAAIDDVIDVEHLDRLRTAWGDSIDALPKNSRAAARAMERLAECALRGERFEATEAEWGALDFIRAKRGLPPLERE
jgi:hypothetical protein